MRTPLVASLGALVASAACAPPPSRPEPPSRADGVAAPAAPLDYRGRLGVTHWDARYHFTDRPILEEGADRIWDLGARAIKLELETSGKYRREYAFHHTWGEYPTVRELVASPDYVAAINRPWRWVSFQIGEAQRAIPVEWCDGMSAEEIAAEQTAFYELTRYLLVTYAESGISFLLDNWEGDNALDENRCHPTGGGGADWITRDGMVKWLSARQAGIVRARAEVGEHGVHVYGGAECNSTPDHEWPAGTGSQCGTNVVPYIDPPPDLCGLSSYRDLAGADMSAAIAWMRERCGRDVYIAELGAAGNAVGDDVQLAITRAQAASAIANGAVLVLYWQLFSNECVAGCPNDPVRDADVRGFWLVRPEPRERGGTPTPTWDWMAAVLADNRAAAAPRPAASRIVARTSDHCLRIGEGLEQVACAPDDLRQVWRIADAGGERVQLGLDVDAQGHLVGAASGTGWRLVPVPDGGGYVTLEHAARGQCLTLARGTYDDGPHLDLAACTAAYDQQFVLRAARDQVRAERAPSGRR